MTDDTGPLTTQANPIMVRLKAETKDHHRRLESLSYFSALIDHKLPLECYFGQLSALAVLHGVMENEIAACADRRVAAVWNDELKKLPLLEKDLAFLSPRVTPDHPSVIQVALAMAERIRLRGIEKPVTLLGYLYVFEGSTLGNARHRPDIAATFHLTAQEGSGYFASYQDQVESRWKGFSEKMDALLADPSVHDSIIEAAHEAFEGLKELYSTLYPLKKEAKVYHVTHINPEAGNHPIPNDEREIEAALKASDRGWAEFPYYEQRYGPRGKRFSDSDACWLVTLTRLDQDSLQKQIDWISRVLATRGMPSIMLEKTLRFLHEALVKAIPDNTPTYDKLLLSADSLKKAREKVLPEPQWQPLLKEFDQAVGPELTKKFMNTGELLGSSVADEKNGIEGAIAAIQVWMADESRFPEQWIGAVNRFIEKARQRSA